MIRLSNDVVLNSYVQIACLPDPSKQYYPTSINITSYAAGWGTLSYGGLLATTLKNVKLTVYSSYLCDQIFPSVLKDFNSQLCAGKPTLIIHFYEINLS